MSKVQDHISPEEPLKPLPEKRHHRYGRQYDTWMGSVSVCVCADGIIVLVVLIKFVVYGFPIDPDDIQ